MTKEEAISLLQRREFAVFNKYRDEHPDWVPDFSNENLQAFDLIDNGKTPPNLSRAILVGTRLPSSSRFAYNDKTPILTDAIIDSQTSGISLSQLQLLGAQFASKEQIEKSNRASKTRVFISYAWADAAVVSAIVGGFGLRALRRKLTGATSSPVRAFATRFCV